MMGFRLGRRRCSIQEIIFLLFFLLLIRSFRIITLHFHSFLRRQLLKVTKKENEFPTVVCRAWTRKGRHSRKSHAIFDHPKKFTVGEFLRFGQAQVRRLRIQPVANHGIAAAVVSMTDGAVVSKVNPGVAKVFFRGRNGILLGPGRCRHREMSRLARHHCFHSRRCSSGAQAMVQNRGR